MIILLILSSVWPAILLAWVVGLYAYVLINQVPRIWQQHGFTRWLGLALGVSLLGVLAGSILVMQAPWVNVPASMEPKPVALVGLWLAAWSTFLFVVVTELESKAVRTTEEVTIDQILKGSWNQQPA